MRQLQVQGELRWVSTDAATEAANCGCAPGARYDEAGKCVACEDEGVECPGMGVVKVFPGYYSAANVSIFKCRKAERCVGGEPGRTCATGRVGVSCSRCADGFAPADEGTCEACSPGDVVPFILACTFMVLACCSLYLTFEISEKSRARYSTLLVGVSAGLMLGLMQQLSVMGMLSVKYEEPLQTFLRFVRVVAFDIDDLLRLGCLGNWTALTRFAIKLMMIFVATTIVIGMHIVVVIAWHGRRFRERRAVLVSVLGTIGFVFYTSIIVVMLQPFQCTLHPNGMWTVVAYEDIVCWSSESTSHGAMVIFSLIALLLPISISASVCMTVRQYPRAMRRGDAEFLQSFGFLFIRFRPQVYWYTRVIMFRSLFIGFVPVVPRASAQIYLLQVALIVSFALVIHFKPWRVASMNWLDVLLGAVMLVFLNIASFTAMVAAQDVQIIGWLCMGLALLVTFVAPAVMFVSMIRRLHATARRYQFFLCHHKADMGAFARWLKMELVGDPAVLGDVFLDSDNLDSLDRLLNFVAADTQSLVVLGSRSIYSRPWCIAEMATAYGNGVGLLVLALPGYSAPTREAIPGMFEGLDLECLLENGISAELVAAALASICERPVGEVPLDLDVKAMGQLTERLARGDPQGFAQRGSTLRDDLATVIIANVSDFEANASAHVLRALLTPHLHENVVQIPRVLRAEQDLPPNAQTAIVVFTCGCFEQPLFVAHLYEVCDVGLRAMAVIADEYFEAPSFESLRLAFR
eukprot:CAMPEP_0176023690 /NCGR_PEP_ID=MMETSP0120_2-20121206/11562_1 /TAXON_ID=160619 /ORGANISM="Kryptoperidinium foliaceum, Strain CCMP 1326" /LENGTH=748 /DNA_ID=CAMNT_0017356857 /DNA_START=26 /DNA_END=2268 /DNA_ORIENTATION=+